MSGGDLKKIGFTALQIRTVLLWFHFFVYLSLKIEKSNNFSVLLKPFLRASSFEM
jgi:hypothetical protein